MHKLLYRKKVNTHGKVVRHGVEECSAGRGEEAGEGTVGIGIGIVVNDELAVQ